MRKIVFIFFSLSVGLGLGWVLVFRTPFFLKTVIIPQKQVIGFLPYWLLDKAQVDYSKYVTTLAYFGVTIHSDGSIQKLANAQETEPGWFALKSGKVDSLLQAAKNSKLTLSLVAFNGDDESIARLLDNPVIHAKNFVKDIIPIMEKYDFTDLNIDIESITEASLEGQLRFTKFIKTVREELDNKRVGTLSIDVTTNAFMKTNTNLINPGKIEPYIDHFIIMTYDYHFAGSFVTGPVAPLAGARTIAELDTKVVVEQAITMVSKDKIILGIPLYGYEWETIGTSPRAAIVPGTGIAASSSRVEKFLATCASCSAQLDTEAQEQYIIYKDENTGTYHQIFYPTESSTQKKINLVNQNNIGGLALWALGYEDSTILNPFSSFHR